jgi:hypothetical protein
MIQLQKRNLDALLGLSQDLEINMALFYQISSGNMVLKRLELLFGRQENLLPVGYQD